MNKRYVIRLGGASWTVLNPNELVPIEYEVTDDNYKRLMSYKIEVSYKKLIDMMQVDLEGLD